MNRGQEAFLHIVSVAQAWQKSANTSCMPSLIFRIENRKGRLACYGIIERQFETPSCPTPIQWCLSRFRAAPLAVRRQWRLPVAAPRRSPNMAATLRNRTTADIRHR